MLGGNAFGWAYLGQAYGGTTTVVSAAVSSPNKKTDVGPMMQAVMVAVQ